MTQVRSFRLLFGAGPALCGALLLSVAACDVPTDLPWWDTRWVVPVEGTRMDKEAFLPEGVDLAEDRAAFLVSVEPQTAGRPLGDLCALCVPLDGQTAPKPPFVGSITFVEPFPQDLVEADLEEGLVEVTIDNGLSFDPIRPGPPPGGLEERGEIRIRIRSGSPEGRLLAEDLVSGEDVPFPPGTVLIRELVLAPGLVEAGLFIELEIDSPAGDSTEIDTSERVEGTGEPEPLRVSRARIRTRAIEARVEETLLETEDLDEDFVDRIQEGAIEVRASNPFDLSMDLTIRIRGPETPTLERSVVIAPGTSAPRMEFSGDELRSFLGKPGVTLDGQGAIREGPDAVDVTPDMEVSLDVAADVILRMGTSP